MRALLTEVKEAAEAAQRAPLLEKAPALARLAVAQQAVNIELAREVHTLRADLDRLKATMEDGA